MSIRNSTQCRIGTKNIFIFYKKFAMEFMVPVTKLKLRVTVTVDS